MVSFRQDSLKTALVFKVQDWIILLNKDLPSIMSQLNVSQSIIKTRVVLYGYPIRTSNWWSLIIYISLHGEKRGDLKEKNHQM